MVYLAGMVYWAGEGIKYFKHFQDWTDNGPEEVTIRAVVVVV